MEYYHVITQSYAGKTIIRDDEDCLFYLQTVKMAFQKYGIRWLAYAAMPTHTHLGVYGDLENLAKARRNISYTYGVYVRKKYPELRRVFEEKKQVKLLQTQYDVKKLIRYANLNPMEKQLESVVGESLRSSYSAILARWNPKDAQNPFNHYVELREIRDAIAIEDVNWAFGRNINEQKQEFFSFHAAFDATEQNENATDSRFQKADKILADCFYSIHSFRGKKFDDEGRKGFLFWLNRRGNPAKTKIVLMLAQEARLKANEIAVFLNAGETTVRRILKNRP